MWVCRGDIVARGFTPKTHRLWPPVDEPHGQAPDADAIAFIQGTCQRLQNEMLAFGQCQTSPQFDGTLGALIRCYTTDPDSPYKKLRYCSRLAYDGNLKLLERKADRVLARLTVRDFLRWYDELRDPATPGGTARTYRAHHVMTMLRILLGFGVAFEIEDVAAGQISQCVRLQTILGELRFENGIARSEAITAEQVVALRNVAHEQGDHSVALAQAFQFELVLRQKDVIGEWVPVEEPGLSATAASGRKWLYGLRWEEISPDLILTHRMSKSRVGKLLTFNLRNYPMVMEELARIPVERRSGPVVLREQDGLPWMARKFSDRWRQLARLAGIPDEVYNMDSRAGGTTETLDATDGDLEAARKQAGHASVTTTQRYSRGALKSNSKIARLRVEQRKKEGA
ncbi:MAG: hypothetical protein Q7R45_08310 [Sulfuricaulis sp.]|nr:hypothetical protein [Sulfuricaulis sp.]